MTTKKSGTAAKKTSMKKKILTGALILILIIAVILVCVLTRLDVIVKASIETYGTRAAGTAVRVESVKIRLREGSAAIRGLSIANPQGFADRYAFSLGETGVGINIRSLTEEVKVINDIRVLAPEIFVEINSAGAVNLDVIRKNLEQSASREKAVPPSKSAQGKKNGRVKEPRLIVRHILFADGSIQARIAALKDKTVQLRLPSIEMRNLGGKSGATPDEITRQILGELCRRAVARVEGNIGAIAEEKAKDAAKSQIERGVERLLR
jgi:hypothetical protein